MQLTAERRAKTGAFYTPQEWAELAVLRLERVLPALDEMTVYDPAAGEGALLDAVRRRHPYALTVGTTLEAPDVRLLDGKGHVAAQFDFLTMNTRFLPSEIHLAREEGRLVVLTNPPFVRLPAERCQLIRRRYPAAGNDSVCLFLLRALRELRPLVLATFSDMGIWQGPSFRPFREAFGLRSRALADGFLTRSRTWPGLRGDFAIAFGIFFGLAPLCAPLPFLDFDIPPHPLHVSPDGTPLTGKRVWFYD